MADHEELSFTVTVKFLSPTLDGVKQKLVLSESLLIRCTLNVAPARLLLQLIKTESAAFAS
jgi:hypothetical protein